MLFLPFAILPLFQIMANIRYRGLWKNNFLQQSLFVVIKKWAGFWHFPKKLLWNSLPPGKNVGSNVTEIPHPWNDLWSRARTRGQQDNSNSLPPGQSERSKCRPMPRLPPRRLDIDRCIIQWNSPPHHSPNPIGQLIGRDVTIGRVRKKTEVNLCLFHTGTIKGVILV